jgi:hypothetical protein
MHTYRKVDLGWQAALYHSHSGTFEPVGPIVQQEWEAAALASFLNGGRYNPYEIEAIFRADPAPEDDDDSTYPRPQGMDYEPEAARK